MDGDKAEGSVDVVLDLACKRRGNANAVEREPVRLGHNGFEFLLPLDELWQISRWLLHAGYKRGGRFRLQSVGRF